MTEKIPQHRHCRGCGRAFIGKEEFCSEECKTFSNTKMKKKRQQLMLLYAFSFVVLILMLVLVGFR
jgi:predicted nucleic acid-binding Zn ribbon protein